MRSLINRLLLAVVLLNIVVNPTEYSLFSWITSHNAWSSPLLIATSIFSIILCLGTLILFSKATYRAIGISGVIFVIALLVSGLSILLILGVPVIDNWEWIVPNLFALVIGIGLWAPLFWRTLTNQVPVTNLSDEHHDHHKQ